MANTINKVGVWDEINGVCHITHFNSADMLPGETEDDFIARYTARLKLSPTYAHLNCTLIDKKDIPKTKENRNEWSLKNGKVEVDPVKVAAKEAKEAERQAVFTKLGVTEDEFNKATKKA